MASRRVRRIVRREARARRLLVRSDRARRRAGRAKAQASAVLGIAPTGPWSSRPMTPVCRLAASACSPSRKGGSCEGAVALRRAGLGGLRRPASPLGSDGARGRAAGQGRGSPRRPRVLSGRREHRDRRTGAPQAELARRGGPRAVGACGARRHSPPTPSSRCGFTPARGWRSGSARRARRRRSTGRPPTISPRSRRTARPAPPPSGSRSSCATRASRCRPRPRCR